MMTLTRAAGLVLAATASMGAHAHGPAPAAAVELSKRCAALPEGLALPENTVIHSLVLNPATPEIPEHCQVDGEINHRRGIDGQQYGIHFRLRLPTTNWNGRFYMRGGGGTNGVLIDPAARVAEGYATIGTDSGHDNTVDKAVQAGGIASFGVDPQARIDFAYNAYDLVTQAGKALVTSFYQSPPAYAYFEGCSEGGREGMLMSQRFPAHYDGIISGDPAMHLPLGPLSGIYTTQLFVGLAQRGQHFLTSGQPAIGKTYSDGDLQLVSQAVLAACDELDGLADGIVDNMPACTSERVAKALTAVRCTAEKNDSCLTGDQISTLQTAFAGAVDSNGKALYSDWPWDAGIGGRAGSTYNQGWRSWWLGAYGAPTNTAIKLNFATPLAVVYSSPPLLPIAVADSLRYSMDYDFDRDPRKLYTTSDIYAQSAASLYITDATDLSAFRARGGKIMIYQGGSDSAISTNALIGWYRKMSAAMGPQTQEFARMFVVPGMNHCRGGPATDSFDMLPQLVRWVEGGTAPESVVAKASTPAYFGVAARSRPLCPYPKQARYRGTGDINEARNFSCK